MINVADVIRSTAATLNDEDHVRWPVAELFDAINQAASATVVLRPSANAVSKNLTLVEGAEQTLPQDSIQLLDIIANDDGTPVDRTERYLLDAQAPGWRKEKKRSRIRHFTYDDRAPNKFYVYPPAEAGVVVEAMYSEPPPLVTSETDTLALGRVYLPAIINYVLYRAFSKDSEFADGQIAMLHYQSFSQALGIQNQSAVAVSPNKAAP